MDLLAQMAVALGLFGLAVIATFLLTAAIMFLTKGQGLPDGGGDMWPPTY